MPLIGAALRNARTARGLSIDQAAQDTRISARFLEALEDERFEALPAPVYVRGFLRSYANYLRIDPQPLMDRLGATQGAGVAGPDGFVRGPRTGRLGVRPASRDPWRRMSQEAPSPLAVPGYEGYDDDAEEWAPQGLDEPRDSAGAFAPAESGPYENPADGHEESGYGPEEPAFRPRRVEGVLVEREAEYNDAGGPMRFIALAGGGIIALVFFIVVGVLLAGGGDDDGGTNAAGGGLPTATPARGSGTVVAIGSATAQPSVSPAASASPSAAASPSPGTSPAASPSPEPPTATPTATPRTNQPEVFPTQTPTPTETPTPTNTPVPATPTPPPPTPTPFPSHPLTTQECINNTCGSAPIRVVCVPGGGWFVDRPDVNGTFPAEKYGWTVKSASSAGQVASVCP